MRPKRLSILRLSAAKKKAMPAALDAAGEELLAEVIAAGSPIPSGQLNDLAARVSAVNGEAVPAKMAMKRSFISNWVADHSDGDASAAAAAPAPAPVTNTPPGARPPNAPIDRKDVVLALRGYQGGDIPAASIADLTHSIEQLDGVKAPGNLRQRRTFLDDWYHANSASVPPEPPAAAEEEPPPAMEALPPRPAAAGVPPPLPTAASGGEEAALYSELSDALAATDGKLSAASVSNLALRLAELLGVEPPSLLVQRRRFLDDWHREKGGAAPGGGPYNSADYGGGGGDGGPPGGSGGDRILRTPALSQQPSPRTLNGQLAAAMNPILEASPGGPPGTAQLLA